MKKNKPLLDFADNLLYGSIDIASAEGEGDGPTKNSPLSSDDVPMDIDQPEGNSNDDDHSAMAGPSSGNDSTKDIEAHGENEELVLDVDLPKGKCDGNGDSPAKNTCLKQKGENTISPAGSSNFQIQERKM